MRQKAKRSETVVERDHDRPFFGERTTVVSFLAAEAGPESAAMNPDKNGKRDAGSGKRERLRPDIEVETILGHTSGERIDVVVRLMLNTVVSELAGVAYARPVSCWLWRAPAQVADWWRGVRDSTKDQHTRGVEAFESASVDSHARRGGESRRADPRENYGADRRQS